MVDGNPSLEGLPARLEDIVRRNRHRFEVGLATAEEIADVTGRVAVAGREKGSIADWRIVALRHRPMKIITLHILGRFERWPAWFTSYVVALSVDRAHVRTKNSLYQLGRAANGEPEIVQLVHVAYVLKAWGLNDHYDLGVVDVFY